jgi:hypothetical protein
LHNREYRSEKRKENIDHTNGHGAASFYKKHFISLHLLNNLVFDIYYRLDTLVFQQIYKYEVSFIIIDVLDLYYRANISFEKIINFTFRK